MRLQDVVSVPAPQFEALAGLVERVTYHNPENGFCVLRIKARGHRVLVTVIRHAAAISPGEWVTASGGWENERDHGPQFRARFLRTSAPTSTEGIEKYLGSGMICGIGPIYAKRMVRLFGKDVFDIIEAEPRRLRRGGRHLPKRAATIAACGRAEGYGDRNEERVGAAEVGRSWRSGRVRRVEGRQRRGSRPPAAYQG
jgi:exodeoxyribonuclease V alpha subunit